MLTTKRKPASVGEILVEEFMAPDAMHSPRDRERIERARPLSTAA
jgi:plasmid maintenance system antidote protein VapI